jgi:SH3-like domain-containing protein
MIQNVLPSPALSMRLILTFLVLFLPSLAWAQESGFRSTALPLPRFAALKSDKVYARAGPDQRYPVTWVYQREGLPVEIIQEYDAWRKIRDPDGGEGWIHKSLLSGKREVLIVAKDTVTLKENPEPQARIMARAEPHAIARLDKCNPGWCRIEADGYKGWVERNLLWGIYATEELN